VLQMASKVPIATWAPNGLQMGSKWAPNGLQMGSKMSFKCSKGKKSSDGIKSSDGN
jgi:hypothetical protein